MSDSVFFISSLVECICVINLLVSFKQRKRFAETFSRKSSSLASMVKAAPNRRGQTQTPEVQTRAEAVRQKFVSA